MIRSLFVPAIQFFNRFKYIQMVIVLFGIFFIPAIAAFYLYFVYIQSDLLQAKKGLMGIEYIRLLRHYLEDLQQYRGLSVGKVKADSSLAYKLKQKHDEMIHDILEIDHVDQRVGSTLGTTVKWAELKYRWYDHEYQRLNQTPEQVFASESMYIRNLLELMEFVGDSAGLSLDSEYASYYLVTGITKTIPEFSEVLGQMRAVGLMMRQDQPNESQRLRFASLQSLLNAKRNDLNHQVKIIEHDIPHKNLSIPNIHQTLQKKLDQLIPENKQTWLNLPAIDYYSIVTDTIDVCFSLYDSELASLQEIYQDRSEKIMDNWYIMIGVSIFVFLIMMYSFIAFYLSVTETVRNLKNTSKAIVSGNLPTTVPLSLKHDLLEIGDTVNQITHNLHQQKISIMGQMAAGMAHEIRNPLTSIRGFTQFMKKGVEEGNIDPETFLQYLDICQEEIKAIEGLVANFLILARKNEVAMSQNKPVHLQTVLHRVHELSKHFVIEKDVFLTFRYDDESCVVLGVETHIEQIALNLVKNAIDAVSFGGKVSLRTSVDNAAKQAIISIQDNGAGIPEERMQHLFEPFYTTKEKGTGIGLSVCKKLLEEMAGSIAIHSEEGFGTTAIVRLPLAKAPSEI